MGIKGVVGYAVRLQQAAAHKVRILEKESNS